jgi:vancomycin resistance protein YoaR
MRLWPRKQVYLDDLPKTHDLRFAALFLILFLALLGAVYAVGFFVAGDRLARGASVAGVDIGGMRGEEARTELQDRLVPRLSQPIKVTVSGRSFTVDGEQAGLSFDVDATVQQGLGSSRWDPTHMLDVVMGGHAIDPVVTVDDARLNRVLSRLARAVEVKAVNARVLFGRGQPRVAAGHDGVQLDFARAGVALQTAVLDGVEEVTLPVHSVPAGVSVAEARRFADGAAARAVSGPVRIRVADVTRTVGIGVFAPTLRTVADGGNLKLTLDETALSQRSRAILATLPHHPANARIEFRKGRPVIIPSTSGVSVSAPDWAAAVLHAAQQPQGSRLAGAQVTPDAPTFTTFDARRLKIDRRLTSVSLPVPRQVDLSAVNRAATRLDGALLRPRADFSFLSRVGARDPAASTLLASAAYDAAFRAGMENIFRSAPSVAVVGAEPGLDAVVARATELAWVNQTPYGVYVHATVSSGSRPEVTVALWSHPFWNVSVRSTGRYNVVPAGTTRITVPGCQPRRGVDGFDVDVSRTLSRPGQKARIERTHSHYASADAVVCAGRRHR